MTKNSELMKWLSYLSGGLVAGIALLAFVLSFNNIQKLAVDNNIAPSLAWIVPLIVDGSLVVFALAVLIAALQHKRAWWLWTLVVGFTLVSVAFNVAHSNMKPFGIAIAILIPASLFFSFETLMWQVKTNMQAAANTAYIHLQHRLHIWKQAAKRHRQRANILQVENTTLQAEIARLKQYEIYWQALNRKTQAVAMLHVGDFASQEQAAEWAKISPSTISRHAKQVNGVSHNQHVSE